MIGNFWSAIFDTKWLTDDCSLACFLTCNYWYKILDSCYLWHIWMTIWVKQFCVLQVYFRIYVYLLALNNHGDTAMIHWCLQYIWTELQMTKCCLYFNGDTYVGWSLYTKDVGEMIKIALIMPSENTCVGTHEKRSKGTCDIEDKRTYVQKTCRSKGDIWWRQRIML